MRKSKTEPARPKFEQKQKKSLKTEVFDQDNAWKNFITTDIFDCLAVVHPILYAAVDKAIAPVFLEQEMSNIMRGKYKVIGKDKKTDKLVKLQLLNGEDYYVYLHLEVQDQLRDTFPERIYIYRSLISLRYQTQKITSIVIFTGKSPSEKHKVFKEECFNSTLLYTYTSYVIADQDEEALAVSNNPFALAVLAAKYTINTEGDARRRFKFKQKVFELARKKQFSVEKMEKLLSFVLDYMLLSEDMENEFIAQSPIFSSLNTDTMEITRGQRALAEMASRAIYGKPFDEFIAEKEAEKEAERRHAIHSLLKINFSAEKIADILGFDLDYVLKVAEDAPIV